MSGSYKEHAGK